MALAMAITTMSSKGQIVIPKDLRKDYKKGDKLLLLKSGTQLVIKRADKVEERMVLDPEFVRRIDRAWKRYDRGEFESMPAEQFLKELEKW